MKPVFKTLLKYYLKLITKITLYIHQPLIIAVAGSSNKPFVKEEIKKLLIGQGASVRANPKNFNTEIGLPLAVLYLPSGYNKFKSWLPIILKAPKRIYQQNFPKYLVLQLGTSDPGDMNYLLSIVKPNISIITDLNQRYLESFSDMDQLVYEYQQLAEKTDKNGLLVLNFDNPRIKSLAAKTSASVASFSIEEQSDWQAIRVAKTPSGQKVTIKHKDSHEEQQIFRFGKHHIYSLLISRIIKDYALQQKN